jgi:hypothetical protein
LKRSEIINFITAKNGINVARWMQMQNEALKLRNVEKTGKKLFKILQANWGMFFGSPL